MPCIQVVPSGQDPDPEAFPHIMKPSLAASPVLYQELSFRIQVSHASSMSFAIDIFFPGNRSDRNSSSSNGKFVIHIWDRTPMYTWRPSRANTARAKMVRIITSLKFLTEYIIALTIVLRPGITATDLSARNTRNVRRAEKLPKSTAIVTYDIPITEKSNQFHASRKYVKLSKANPLANSFTDDS